MAKKVTASTLRENVYTILDQIIESGVPIEITRKGHLLRIIPSEPASRLARLKKRRCLNVPAEEILGLDWSKEWREAE